MQVKSEMKRLLEGDERENTGGGGGRRWEVELTP